MTWGSNPTFRKICCPRCGRVRIDDTNDGCCPFWRRKWFGLLYLLGLSPKRKEPNT